MTIADTSGCLWACVKNVVPQGEPWRSAIAGHDLDPATQQADQQRLMLERFQAEVGVGVGLGLGPRDTWGGVRCQVGGSNGDGGSVLLRSSVGALLGGMSSGWGIR